LVPNTVGLYFFGGFWYRFYGGYWYRASLYSGPWITIRETLLPPAVVVIPPDYILSMPPGYYRIHYAAFHSHWRDWGRSHYWNRQAWYRDHSQHRWGGREFYRGGPGDKGGRSGGEKVGPGRKTGEERKAGPGGSTGGAERKVGAEKVPRGGGPGAGKPAGAEPKAGHPAKPE
jgi:hypothetical protein